MPEHATPTLLTQPALEFAAASIGRAIVSGEVPLPLTLTLRGPLGAGKSVFARALARSAGVDAQMPSPTYNLLFTYEAGDAILVHHLDLYRLEDPEDLWELGWRELGEGRQLVLVEWPERAEALMPADRWDITLAPVDGSPELREVRIEQRGEAPPVLSPAEEGR